METKDDHPPRPVFRAPQESFKVSDFVYGRLLGLGSYSKVMKATKRDTGLTYALKIMDKRHIMKENKISHVKLERILLDQLDHPGIVRLYFTFQDAYHLYMALECCDGGELFEQIRMKGILSLDEARFYAAELVDVMEYIHKQGVVHRDLKPENLLLTSEGHLKLTDFGSAKVLRPLFNGLIQNLPDDNDNLVGTAEYVSPEVLNGSDATAGVDLWALGCVIYQLLVGKPPFKGASEYLTFQKIMAMELLFPDHVASEAKDLITSLLNLDPEKRIGMGPDGYLTLKAHPFFYGVNWACLRELPAPSLAMQTEEDLEGSDTTDDDENLDPDWKLAFAAGVSYTEAMGSGCSASPTVKVNDVQKTDADECSDSSSDVMEIIKQKLMHFNVDETRAPS